MATEPARLFVYGTLQPGHLRWPFLAPYAVGDQPADVPGRLYDSGHGWPVATFVAGPLLVPGTLVDLERSRLAEALRLLDDVEASATDVLTRTVVTTTSGSDAWAYHAATIAADMVPIPRWIAHDER